MLRPCACSRRRSPQDDYRFGLLWEWNLYDAMLYSPYVASRLQTYTEKGRNMLDLLVAKLGIPLEEAQRSYVGEGCEWQPAPGPMLSCRLRSGRGLGFVHPTPSPASLADPSPLPPLFLATALHCRRRHGAAVPAQPAGEAGSARARLPPLRCHLQVVPVTGGWVG